MASGFSSLCASNGKIWPDANVTLNDDELIYMRLNPRTHTPFGLGRLEVAFETINSFLSAHRFASRLVRTQSLSMRCASGSDT